jgi:replicative DNA helicase
MLAARKNHAKTTRGILTGAKYADYSNVEKDLIQKAAKVYAYYAGHIRIFESIGKFSVEEIAEKVQTHIHLTGRRPVVLVDYLQILQPPDQGASDKANMDTIMLQLKQLSRDIEIPVFAISSFNRENYETPVNAGAFKESGSIEYGCDVLFALQYEGMDYQDGEAKEARLKRIRQLTKSNEQKAADGNAVRIQLKTLKNRNGKKGQVLFDFWPMFNTFREASLAGMPEYGTAESVLQRASNEVDVFADIRKPK